MRWSINRDYLGMVEIMEDFNSFSLSVLNISPMLKTYYLHNKEK